MSPLHHRQAPRTPPRPRSTATRTLAPNSRSAPGSAAPKARPTRLDSGSPVRLAAEPASLGAPVKRVHGRTVQIDSGADENDAALESPIADKRAGRKLTRAEHKALRRSEGGGAVSAPDNIKTRRRSSFSKVTLSDRASLADLGQRAPTPAVTPIALSPYVPPHIRKAPLSSAAKENDPLARFDRSGCPEAEDSFYTHVSSAFSAFSSPSPYSTPNTSFAYSTTNGSSARIKAGVKGVRLPFSPALPPRALGAASIPLSPAALNSFEPYLDPTRHSHPIPILEESKDDLVPASASSWADEVDEEYPVDEYRALTPNEEVLLGQHGAEDESDAGVDVPIGVSFHRRSTYTAFSSTPGLPEDEIEASEGACSGCGTGKTDCFVNLTPCGHSICPVCVNTLINAVAHKPPRPTACFACAAPISSFVPTTPAIEAGNDLVAALRKSFAESKVERRPSCGGSDLVGDQGVQERRSRRRGSVVAAALATVFSTPTKNVPFSPASSSPAKTLTAEDESPLARRSCSSSARLTDSPPSPLRLRDSRMNAATDELRDPSTSSAARVGKPVPNLIGSSQRVTFSQDVFRTAPDVANLVMSAAPPLPELKSVDWPVVRIDNVPWEVTVDELEAWLPRGCLASDVGFGDERDGKEEQLGEGEGVALAVHILCNRADGRTLNQAYVECRSRAAARQIVRFRDGVKLRARPAHVSISSQTELLSTVFPTYRPGFDGPIPRSHTRGGGAPPVPLLVQTELTGLLNLCRLESMHAMKAPERPFFNIVTILEKMPWAYPTSYNAAAVVRLFSTSCAAIEILGTVKHTVVGWQNILAVLVDAILRCPTFRPQQKQKAVRLAASLGFERHERTSNKRVPLPPHATPPTVAGVFDGFSFPFRPASLKQSFVSTAPDPTFIPPPDMADVVERFEDLESEAASSSPAVSERPPQRGTRRRSSLVAELGIEPALLDAVAKALGIALVGSARADEEGEGEKEGEMP